MRNIRVPVLIAIAAVLAAALYTPGLRVVDGDTVDHAFWRWRLVGFDAPETRRAKTNRRISQ
ncbi:MAG: hypothetical protein ABL894_13920 [Hyphomicrobium sp.]